jgi:hypothetical protein
VHAIILVLSTYFQSTMNTFKQLHAHDLSEADCRSALYHHTQSQYHIYVTHSSTIAHVHHLPTAALTTRFPSSDSISLGQ